MQFAPLAGANSCQAGAGPLDCPKGKNNGAGMSEAMSKVEIEDVLSSIRRLVSEDSRPSIVRGGPPLERHDMTLGPERLILTPALRVVAEEQAEELVDPPEPPQAAPIGALVAGLGAAVDAQDEQWEPETGDEPPPLPEGAAALEDAEWDGDGPALTFAAYPRVQLTNPIMPPRAAPASSDAVDVIEEEVIADPWAAAPYQPDVIEPVDVMTPDHPEVADWAQEGEDEPQETLARGAPTIEPDMAWADAAEAEAVEELSGQIASRIDPIDAEAMGQEALREMVRLLIVEELQGALGQRITRNIRKLVRAEIARALATEQLY